MPTSLGVGQAAIISYETDVTSVAGGSPDAIRIVLLQAVTSGTVIYLTDRAWNGTSFAAASAGEGTLTITVGPLAAGSILTFTAAQLTAAGITLSNAGETVYLYQGTSADAPTQFLFAADIADGNTTFNGSLVSTGLTNGVNAVAVAHDNAAFQGMPTEIPATLLTAISNTVSWSGSDQDDIAGTTLYTEVSDTTVSNVFANPDVVIIAGMAGGGQSDAILRIGNDENANVGSNLTRLFRDNPAFNHISDVTFDLEDGFFFFVDSDGNSINRIMRGSIADLVSGTSSPTFTQIFITDNRDNGAGAVIPGEIIVNMEIDKTANKIYWMDGDLSGTYEGGFQLWESNYDGTGQRLIQTIDTENTDPNFFLPGGVGDFAVAGGFAYVVSSTGIVDGLGNSTVAQNHILKINLTSGAVTYLNLGTSPGGYSPGRLDPLQGQIIGIDVDTVTGNVWFVTQPITANDHGGVFKFVQGSVVGSTVNGTLTEIWDQPTNNAFNTLQTFPTANMTHIEVDEIGGRVYISAVSDNDTEVDGTPATNESDASIFTLALNAAANTAPTLFIRVFEPTANGSPTGMEIDYAPVTAVTSAAATYLETAGSPSAAGTPVAVLSGATVTDADNSLFQGATLAVTAGFVAGDTLAVTVGATGIVASYNAANGVLTLTGARTVAQYQSVIASLTFTNAGDNPTNFGASTSRTISVTTFDGLANSDPATATLTVTGRNDAPTSSGLQGDSVTTTEPAGAGSTLANVKIDAGGSVTIADVDSANFNGGSIRFAITAGLVAGQDQLVIDTAAATTVTVAAGVVSVGGTAIGTVTGGGAGGGDLVVTFNTANATPALVQTLIRAIDFANTGGDNPTAGARTITTTLIDGGGTANSGTDTLTITSTVTVAATNDTPTITGLPASLPNFTPGVEGNVDLSASTFGDVDSANLSVIVGSGAGGGTFATTAVAGITIGGTAATPTFSGTIAAINAYFDTPSNIRWTPSANFNGSNSINVTVSDGALSIAGATIANVSFAPLSLVTPGTAVTQNFDALANTGTTNELTIRGWALSEAGTTPNQLYGAGTGSSNAGDTYSFGTGGSTERALGGLQSAAVIPTIGAAFTNNTGVTLTSLLVSYFGEQWRNGGANLADRLDFQVSTNATSLTTGTWTDVDALDFISPIVSAVGSVLDGNLAANRTAVTSEITGLTLASGATIWIRWTDFNVAGSDAGLAVDDFSITARSLTAAADTGTVAENATITNGNLFANDASLGGAPALSIASVNGGANPVGTQFALASGALLTVNANGTYSYNPNGAFNYLIDAATALATGAVNTSATDTFTYTLTGATSALQTATVTVTVNGVASAGDQLRGGAGNNTITGTAGVDTFDLSQGGNDTVSGGASNDSFFFGGTFDQFDTVDGGAGSNDQVGLQGNYSGGIVLGPNTLTNVEVLAALPGFSYNITSNDGNVAAGQQLVIFGGNLLAGNNFTFNGSAETDGRFRMYGGLGNDTFTGGAGDDGFYFGPGKWGAGDTIVGGGGTNDQLALDGDYTVLIGANAGVETLILLPGPVGTPNTFDITLDNVWTGSGATKTVWGLNVTTSIRIDATAETDGNLIIFGGQGSDNLLSGSGADNIYGGGGGDFLFGGSGADVFRYDAITDSNGSTNATRDRIVDFSPGSDKIDLSRIDAITGGADDAFTYIGVAAFSNVAGQLRYTDAGGGIYIVEGDVNGDGVADFTLSVTTAPLTPPIGIDFIL